jgi:predicted PurR-regulated permease PerM
MHSDFYRRCFQLATAVVLGYALYKILDPLITIIAWAAMLAFIFYPLHERLLRRLKGRTSLSAGIVAGLTPFIVFVPLSVLGVVFAGQVARVIGYLREHAHLSYPETLDWFARLPLLGAAVAWVRDNASVSAQEVQAWVTDGLQALLKTAATMGGNVALGVFGTVVSFFMMIFALFFFLRDGRAIVDGLVRLIPVRAQRRTQLLKYLGDVTRAVVYGSTVTALIQGVIVGVGFAIVGLPSPVVFGVLAAVAAFLPTGSALVTIPAVIYLAVVGRWGAAIFLTAWTALMWVSENLMRPLLTAHHAEVSTLAIFLGAIGGVAAFGLLGLVLGPVILSFVVALVRFAREATPGDA